MELIVSYKWTGKNASEKRKTSKRIDMNSGDMAFGQNTTGRPFSGNIYYHQLSYPLFPRGPAEVGVCSSVIFCPLGRYNICRPNGLFAFQWGLLFLLMMNPCGG